MSEPRFFGLNKPISAKWWKYIKKLSTTKSLQLLQMDIYLEQEDREENKTGLENLNNTEQNKQNKKLGNNRIPHKFFIACSSREPDRKLQGNSNLKIPTERSYIFRKIIKRRFYGNRYNIVKKITILSLLGLIFLLGGSAFAQEGEVSCSVQARVAELSISDGIVDYGLMDLGRHSNTENIGDNQIIENTGNLDLALGINSNNTASWTLGARSEDPCGNGTDPYISCGGVETFVDQYEMGDTATGSWTDMTTTNTDTGKTLDANTTTNLFLQVHTPTATIDPDQQTWNVEIVGTEL